MTESFSDKDYWKGIVLYGLNTATYKIALGKTLLEFANAGENIVPWDDLSKVYLEGYLERLTDERKPQQGFANKRTKMERIVSELELGALSHAQAIDEVASTAFEDVIPRFQTIGRDKEIVKERFYEIDYGKRLVLKDSLLSIADSGLEELEQELDARWALLEGAFTINHTHFELANDVRDIYLADGYNRKSLTTNIPFLGGYQNNTCFYCSEPIEHDDVHVDHVLPRQVLNHDEAWNLVLSHSTCNLSKSDHLVGKHYIEKLIARNENIMGSNHPWKQKIFQQLGKTPAKRRTALEGHYDNVKKVIGADWWGGIDNYNPSTDPFYRSLITQLNK
jgi:hypothetical protein